MSIELTAPDRLRAASNGVVRRLTRGDFVSRLSAVSQHGGETVSTEVNWREGRVPRGSVTS